MLKEHKVFPPSTGEGIKGRVSHKYIATALLSPSPQPSPIKREREDLLSYFTIIKNPYDLYLDNNPAFQLFYEGTKNIKKRALLSVTLFALFLPGLKYHPEYLRLWEFSLRWCLMQSLLMRYL